MNGMALCSGVGGLDLALRRLGVGCVGMVERDAFAAAVLVARMEDTSLDPAPIWSDVSTFDGRAWRGLVDVLSAGYPCQPFSVAGKKLGAADERHLWPHVRRVIDECKPAVVVLENVERHVRDGLREVLVDLAALGFDAEWGVVAASDAGAPHRRERVFVLAYRHGDGLARLRECRLLDGEREALGDDAHGRGGEALADAGRLMSERPRDARDVAREAGAREGAGDQRQWGGRPALDRGEGSLADTDRFGPGSARPARKRAANALAQRAGVAAGAPSQWPPRPDDRAGWAEVLDRAPHLEPAVRRVAHGIPDRVDRLRCLGNGAVPAQVKLAFRELARRAVAA